MFLPLLCYSSLTAQALLCVIGRSSNEYKRQGLGTIALLKPLGFVDVLAHCPNTVNSPADDSNCNSVHYFG